MVSGRASVGVLPRAAPSHIRHPLQRKLSGSSLASYSTQCSNGNGPEEPLSTLLHNSLGRDVELDDDQQEFVSALGLPEGLAQELLDSHQQFPVRLWILDNSGSMSTGDGHRLVDARGGEKMIGCSRWEELGDSLRWHSRVSAELGAATEFRVLNPVGPPVARCGFGHGNVAREVAAVERLCQSQPTGRTPLCARIRESTERIAEIAPALRAAGQRACLIIASDGAATDGDIAAAMRPLRELPVWVVIRLCTDDDEILEYWNNVDEELELDMDVLDDLVGEAKEVHAQNPWLTYAPSMHRIRERGAQSKLFDLIDEKALVPAEVKAMCELIFGQEAAALPHPEADWKSFLAGVQHLNQVNAHVRDPLRSATSFRKKPLTREWISVRKVSKLRQASCAVM